MAPASSAPSSPSAPPPATPSNVPAGTVTFLVAGRERAQPRIEPFESAAGALAAALELRAADPALRIALHTGEARLRDDGRYVGPAARTAEHLAAIAHPGQILLSATTASALGDLGPPAGFSLVDLHLHRLRDLASPLRVFALQPAIADTPPPPTPPLRSLDRIPNNLPVHLTGFVGRETELTTVGALVQNERLVTLTGVGGAGKTRLAGQVAAAHAERWPDGVWWVELASLPPSAAEGSSQDVARLIAAAAGALVEPIRGPLHSLTLQLRDRRALICLDNCEHVLDGAAAVADNVLRACPELTVLATSREPLALPGEVVWHVPPLDEPDALALFVERASLVRPWFTLDASSEAAVRSMCARLDGIPLALELAAAWLRTLTPRQIEAGLDDRFALLVRGPRGAAPRQQTLAASIDWSHALLDESDRLVFRRLAVFAGTFDIEAARAVCAGEDGAPDRVLDAVGRLVDKSLLVAEERAGHGRYRLLESIRQYAAARLDEAGETPATRDRHLDHYLALVEAAESERLRDMDAWRTRLQLEYDNLRTALEWGLAAGDPTRSRRLAAALPWLWHLNGRGHAGIDYLQRAIRRAPDDRSSLQAQLLTGLALVADTTSPLDVEYDAAQRALEIATEVGDASLRALCLALSAVGQFYTDFDAAWQLTVDALEAGEAVGDPFVVDGARALQGIILHLQDRHAAADPLLQTTIETLPRRHRGVAATALGFQASGALYTGDIDRARRLAEQSVRTAEPLGDYHRIGSARGVLALVNAHAGDVKAGFEVMRPVLRLVEGSNVFVPDLAHTMGSLHLRRGEPEAAATWFERGAGATDRGRPTWIATQSLPGLGAALRALGRTEEATQVLERAVAQARTFGMPRVLANALEQQAHLAAPHDPERAISLHHEALAMRVEHGLRGAYKDSLAALVTLGVRAAPPELPLDEAVAYVRRMRGTRDRPTTGWASLTPTERDVVRLTVEGLSNPEIGARLFMTRATVKTHLSHVYAKLGINNRTALATRARTSADSAPGAPQYSPRTPAQSPTPT